MVVEAHTNYLCQQCYNEKLAQQGKQPLKLWQWTEVVEKKAHRGRIWNVMGNEHFLREEQEQLWRTLLGKNKKGYKDSGRRNLP